jgi:hypothetical protein
MPRPFKGSVAPKISLTPTDIDFLEQEAKGLGYTRAKKGSISLLLQAIASGEIYLVKSDHKRFLDNSKEKVDK